MSLMAATVRAAEWREVTRIEASTVTLTTLRSCLCEKVLLCRRTFGDQQPEELYYLDHGRRGLQRFPTLQAALDALDVEGGAGAAAVAP